MPPADRNNPKLGVSSESKYTLTEFQREFPDDAACLDWLWRERHSSDGSHALCPKCDQERKFHCVKSRPSYSCDHCGHHLHPMAGTIFERSSTSLQLWFYGIFLMSQTRCCVAAKQLERELGVSYKTAFRMFQKIRYYLMDEPPEPFDGEVEVDETYVGPRKPRHRQYATPGRRPGKQKTPVFAIRKRSGHVYARVVEGTGRELLDEIRLRVLPGSIVYSDEWTTYTRLSQYGYDHRRIKHGRRRSGAFVYVEGAVHTNTVENFFSLVKGSLSGVYKGVSKKHLQSYLNEFCWRMNHRNDEAAMFRLLIERAAT